MNDGVSEEWDMGSIQFGQFQFHIKLISSIFYLLHSLIRVGNLLLSAYLEYLLQVVYISSRIVMEEIFLN